jgi:hypothetical protein
MKELQEIVNNKVKKMVEDGIIQTKIEESLQGAIEKAIGSQFETWGNVTKQIEEALKNGLKINPDDIPFEAYSEQMLVLVKTKLGQMFKGAAADRFLSEMDKVLDPAPKEIPIGKFVEKIVSFWKTDDPWDADDLDDEATVEFDNDNHIASSFSLSMWKQKDSSGYSSRSRSADIQLYINKDGEIRINHRQHFNPTCFNQEEAYIFKLYAAGTKLTGLDEFDPDECELTLKDSDY